MIKVKNINKYYNKNKNNENHVINQTTLEFENKNLVALLGKSGSGKTTLLNVMGGLDKINSGEIYINGNKMSKYNSNKWDDIRNKHIGYIFQNYNLVSSLTVYENVELVLKMIGITDPDEIEKRVRYILEKLNIYRYRKRNVRALSGGERQRVGIARALVKNPDIIIADEPTGNLDSKNSLEIMNIIKSISKEKLVILVTHEEKLADFYADRIIKITDGKVSEDFKNENTNNLDYGNDNKIYLKDLKNNENIKSDNLNIDFYNDQEINNLKVKLIVKNNNLYINTNSDLKVQLINEDSPIKLVNDTYKEISKEESDEYVFDLSKLENKNKEIKYKSINSVFKSIKNGFKKVIKYSKGKKVMLVGFIVSAMLICYSLASLSAIFKIDESEILVIDKNYLILENKKISPDEYLEYEKNKNIKYLYPIDGSVMYNLKSDEFYQSRSESVKNRINLLSSIINYNEFKGKLIKGRKPKNNREIIMDKFMIDKNIKSYSEFKKAGFTKIDLMLNKKIIIDNLGEFEIVGISDNNTPSIYVDDSVIFDFMNSSNRNSKFSDYYTYDSSKNNLEITSGRMPQNRYEILINEKYKKENPINSILKNEKINKQDLKVVGFYKFKNEKYSSNLKFVNKETLKIALFENNIKSLSVYTDKKEEVIKYFKEKNITAYDDYKKRKDNYIQNKKDQNTFTLSFTLIIIIISLIEIYLMIRSSFLSRIKEVGIYRAIGVKKYDIYKMFIGEIIAITTLASMTGYIIMSYSINKIQTSTSLVDELINLTPTVFIGGIILIYTFNLLVGLLPIWYTLRKTPAEILSRHDI